MKSIGQCGAVPFHVRIIFLIFLMAVGAGAQTLPNPSEAPLKQFGIVWNSVGKGFKRHINLKLERSTNPNFMKVAYFYWSGQPPARNQSQRLRWTNTSPLFVNLKTGEFVKSTSQNEEVAGYARQLQPESILDYGFEFMNIRIDEAHSEIEIF